MATSTRMSISPSETGLWKIQQTDDAARYANKLLEDDLSVNNYCDPAHADRKY